MLFKCRGCLIVTEKYCHTSDVLLFRSIRLRIVEPKIVALVLAQRKLTVESLETCFLRGDILPELVSHLMLACMPTRD